MQKAQNPSFKPKLFISFSQRLAAILQLCFAFSLILVSLTKPFTEEYFILKNRMLLYEFAFGTSPIFKERSDLNESSLRQFERFKQIPNETRANLLNDYAKLQKHVQRPVTQKILDGIFIFTTKTPPFKLAWMFFSILISILILLKKEGAKSTSWLLVVITIAFIIDNQWTGKDPFKSLDTKLFPSEESLIKEGYLKNHSELSILQQKESLEKGWNSYLLKRWGADLQTDHALEVAEFNFTIARLQLLNKESAKDWLQNYHEKLNLSWLILYLIWNILFAYTMRKFDFRKYLKQYRLKPERVII